MRKADGVWPHLRRLRGGGGSSGSVPAAGKCLSPTGPGLPREPHVKLSTLGRKKMNPGVQFVIDKCENQLAVCLRVQMR